MNRRLVRDVLHPLHERLRGRPTRAFLREMEGTQWRSADEVRAIAWSKLHRLLEHAYANVPFYRSMFDAQGVRPEDVRTEKDLAALPVLGKADIRANLRALCAADPAHLIRYSTGGSTGEPLVFYTDARKEAAHNAGKLRARRWWDVDVGAREVVLWGSPIELRQQDHVRAWKDRHVLNTVLLSAFDLAEPTIARYLDLMRRFRPQVLYGYATVFYRIARYCEDRRIDPGLRDLRIVVTTSEMLYDHQRAAIAGVFQRPVVNEYGNRDGGVIAQECPAGRLHVANDHTLVEYLPVPSRPDLTELVVTNLHGYGMPLIRYRLGDLASPAEARCTCGRGLAIVQDLQGRTNDMLVTPDGRVMHSLSVIYVLREVPALRQFRVVQDAVDHLVVEIVPDAGFGAEGEATIRAGIARLMGPAVRVDLVRCTEIAADAAGKYRWVVSRVERPA